ncbi:DUF2950 family protein [Bordetella petrii]|uniref:DUF2950 family protein n=1 Tax=Bordetella petrii TaxID=94624 RepID=UPI001E2F21D4|nr:DUF2950 family protein [Bordetella petrii]MCD0503823.1 DUF2950 domain-containing protein [Bordetella petrii]
MHNLARWLVAASIMAAGSQALAAQAAFSTPQAAADALVEAVSTGDDAGLRNVLGSDFRRFVPRDSVAREDIYAFLAAWSGHHEIVSTGPSSAEFVVGNDGWSFPAPLVKNAQGWHFDLQAGVKEMNHRRLDRNEDAAIATLVQLCQAQESFRATMGDGKPALRIVSTEGQADGLYWDAGVASSVPSPLTDDALVMGADVPVDAAFHGYRFAVVQPMDPSGCSFAAWPASHGKTGEFSFVIGPGMAIKERDFGRNVGLAEITGRQSRASERWQPVQL